MKYSKSFPLPVALIIGLIVVTVAAASPAANGEDYIFQADDNLDQLAEKYYGTRQAYPAIIEATNTLAVEDKGYNTIANPDRVRIGQRLFIPNYEQVPENLLTGMPLAEYPGLETASETAPTPEQLELLAGLSAKGIPPELNNEVWLNTGPLKLTDLHGKVVLIEFWTYG